MIPVKEFGVDICDLPATGRNTETPQEEEKPDELRHGMIQRRYVHGLPSLYRRVVPRSQADLDRFDRGPFPGINILWEEIKKRRT